MLRAPPPALGVVGYAGSLPPVEESGSFTVRNACEFSLLIFYNSLSCRPKGALARPCGLGSETLCGTFGWAEGVHMAGSPGLSLYLKPGQVPQRWGWVRECKNPSGTIVIPSHTQSAAAGIHHCTGSSSSLKAFLVTQHSDDFVCSGSSTLLF